MKSFIVLAFVCLVAAALASPHELNEDQKVKAKKYFDECVEQTKLTEEETTKLRNKDFSDPTQNMKCFGTCFFEKAGTLKNGVVQEDVVLEKGSAFIGMEKTQKLLEKCRDIKGVDDCDTGFALYKCVENAKAELMIEQ